MTFSRSVIALFDVWLGGILENLGGVFRFLLGGFIISVSVWTTHFVSVSVWTTHFVLRGTFHIILNLMLCVSDLIN